MSVQLLRYPAAGIPISFSGADVAVLPGKSKDLCDETLGFPAVSSRIYALCCNFA